MKLQMKKGQETRVPRHYFLRNVLMTFLHEVWRQLYSTHVTIIAQY